MASRIGNDRVNAGYYNNIGNESGAYANLGDLAVRAGLANMNNSPEFYAGAYSRNPMFSGLPTYEGSFNTPLGQVGLQGGYLEDSAGIRGSYTPNAQAQTMAKALLSLLGR